MLRKVITSSPYQEDCISVRRIHDSDTNRRHQILPGLVRDGDIEFQEIEVLVTSEVEFNIFVVHNVVE